MFALTRSISSGVTWRMPCSLACSAAFCITSSTVSPRTMCLHPLDGSTLAHSRIFAIGLPPSRLICSLSILYLTVDEEAMPFFCIQCYVCPRRCLREALMRKRSISSPAIVANIALMIGVLITSAAVAQMDHGPKTEKTFGIGLPRDHASQLFADKDYPVFPLKPGQEAYKNIDGARMKKDVIALSQIALRYRDTVNKQWWGRFPGTDADKAGMKYMTDEFKRLGLKVESFPYVLPRDWRPQSWNATYTTSNGNKIDLATAFPVSGTKGTGPSGVTAEAIWVGIGAEPDFLGRDVKGKAV